MRRINRCLNRQMLELCQRAIQLDELNDSLIGYLPEHIHAHCRVASFNKGTLLIAVTDAIWATELRYLTPELRDRLRKEAGLYQLGSIKIEVAATSLTTPHTHKKPPQRTLSATAEEELLNISELCTFDPLKQALQKLASRKNNK
ncbi:DciA family protein [Legionella dresdenensis]|uniref:DciA family protein n=1 Tax=Legionella dresdenensis TaxID=450200 RepID=A0ABV8CF60_9GAMM